MGAAVRLRPSCGDDDGAARPMAMAAERRGGEGRGGAGRVRASRCRCGLSSSRLSVGERERQGHSPQPQPQGRENDVASTVDSLRFGSCVEEGRGGQSILRRVSSRRIASATAASRSLSRCVGRRPVRSDRARGDRCHCQILHTTPQASFFLAFVSFFICVLFSCFFL